MNLQKAFSLTVAASASVVFAEATVPTVSDVHMTQDPTRAVTITYKLANGPAVVTVDIQTNVTGGAWASIGGRNIQCFDPESEVWKKVNGAASDVHTIVWHPDVSWPDRVVPAGKARAVVTAWAPDDPPAYMVVNILEAEATEASDLVRYYPGEDFLPGGLQENPDYKRSRLVMRKIPAKNVTFTMGSVWENLRVPAREATHQAVLRHNYYIGVFPVTQYQWKLVAGYNKSGFQDGTAKHETRPAEYMSRNEIRVLDGSAETRSWTESDPAHDWPNQPADVSFLGKLHKRTGLWFDLPSEAQWEWACRAGHGDGYWGNGKLISYSGDSEDDNLPGRFSKNGGLVNGKDPGHWDCPVENGTAPVGSYESNSWGLYDMHGNVWEFCLDWYAEDISSLNGQLNVDPENSGKDLFGNAKTSPSVIRGGSYYNPAFYCRSAYRETQNPANRAYTVGFRLVYTDGIR